jgi:hypothetical protein
VQLFGLDRGEVVDAFVGAFGVEPEHPVQGGGLDLGEVTPRAVGVDQLGLVAADLRFGQGVV